MIYAKINDPSISRIVYAAFPDFEKRGDVRIETFRPGMNVDSYWSSGHRNYWVIVELSSLKACEGRETGPYQGFSDHATLDTLPQNAALVCRTFSGSLQYITIYVNQESLAPLLPAPIEITIEEKKVLFYTRSLKSSYAGIKNYRQHSSGLNLEVWENAKSSLIDKGLLMKNGALTTAGKNVINNVRSM